METDTYANSLLDIVSPLPMEGDLEGRCAICGNHCKRANTLHIVSENFTNWPDLYAGDVFCCRCSRLLKDPIYRRSNWIADADGFRTFKRDEFSSIIRSAKPPYSIFVTRSYKKHGFLHGIYSAVNWHTESVRMQPVHIIFENRVIHFPLKSLFEMQQHIQNLIPIVGKRNLMDWTIAPHHMEKIMNEGVMESYLYIEGKRKSELFEFALHTLPKRKGKKK